MSRSRVVVLLAGVVLAALAAGAAPGSARAASFQVTTTADSGSGSLRDAITASNAATPGPNAITFQIPGPGTHMISPTSALPSITVPVSIDGSSQPGFSGAPLIRLDGAGAGSFVTGLSIVSGASTVRALEITGWGGSGIELSTKGANLVAGSYIGTDGVSALGNETGISIDTGSSANTIGGTTTAARNLISGNSFKGIDINGVTKNIVEGNYIGLNAAGTGGFAVSGFLVSIHSGASQNVLGGSTAGSRNVISAPFSIGVNIQDSGSSSNVVAGNYIGTNAAGTARVGVFVGVNIHASATNNTVGGATAAARNLLSGSSAEGIEIHDFGTTGNAVEGNYIGTDTSGTTALGNGTGFCGISFSLGASSNTVGGTAPGAGNVISGNACGVLLTDNITATNTILGNFIGTNSAGTAALANGDGVLIRQGANQNTIGGTVPGARNVIAASSFSLGGGNGVDIHDKNTSANLIEGNYIGTNATGSGALANQDDGVLITGSANNNTVGGTVAGAGNVVSGNASDGVGLFGSTGTVIAGNMIGTTASGASGLANANDGVGIFFGADSTTIGGTTAAARNVISANAFNGVEFSSKTDRIEGNFIGTDRTGTTALGNQDGIRTFGGATGATIGGTSPGAGNLISGNAAEGVYLSGSTSSGNAVAGNLIGTDIHGTAALGNGDSGVFIAGQATANTIGGPTASSRNVISGNTFGVAVANTSTTGNVIEGNFVGTNSAGTGAVANGTGILLYAGSSRTSVGGATGAGNVISGNFGAGVEVANSKADTIRANFIGTGPTGTLALGNLGDGVLIFNGATSNIVGGALAGQANTIAHNPKGVEVNGTHTGANQMLTNAIFQNGSLSTGPGIALTSGGNANQSPPTITSATLTTVSGTVPPGAYRIEVFVNASCADPEGRKFVGSVNTTTGTWSVTASPALSAGQGVTATARNNATANSSAFSACKTVP